MAAVARRKADVRYEGGSAGTELWGGTQANFLVAEEGQRLREVAVLLTDAGAAFLAGYLGREDSEAFRALAAREAGQRLVERLIATSRHTPPIIMVSRAALEAEPEVLAAVKRGFPKGK
jgi:hypothetical protein